MAKKKGKGPMRDVPGSFVRGGIASGIVSALQDKRAGAELVKAALLGGAALAAGASVENLVFNEGGLMANKRKRGKKNRRGRLDLAELEMMLRANRQTGLAALTPNQQLLLGVALGAGAAWVLSDEELRGKLMRAGMRLFGEIAGGFEELKEQMSDVKAELEAERAVAD